MAFPRVRPRRNRSSHAIRKLVRETSLSPADLVLPLFVIEGKDRVEPIASMPGVSRLSADRLLIAVREASARGILAVALFPCVPPGKKDPMGREAVNPDGLLQQSIRLLKKELPDVTLITDVAMDPYSSDGHDGILRDGEILNDETLEVLSLMAVSQAQAGADIVAPSDMMDGRVGAIRDALDREGFVKVGILSYAAKYASAFYGPFRDALSSAPKQGDKKSYQMDPANRREACREVELDIAEGADMVMVKPALLYLDVIRDLACSVTVPLAAYSVSGEYAMLKFAAQHGCFDVREAMLESLTSIKRAGADIILTYFAQEAAELLD